MFHNESYLLGFNFSTVNPDTCTVGSIGVIFLRAGNMGNVKSAANLVAGFDKIVRASAISRVDYSRLRIAIATARMISWLEASCDTPNIV